MTRQHSTKGASQRQLRVGEELRHILAGILGRGELRDPDLHDRTVTVTEVRVSPDLKNATAFIMPLGGTHSPEVIAALRRAAPYLRGAMGRELQLRHIPQLSFELDLSFDNALRIAQLLRRPDIQHDLDPSEEDETPTDPAVPPADGA